MARRQAHSNDYMSPGKFAQALWITSYCAFQWEPNQRFHACLPLRLRALDARRRNCEHSTSTPETAMQSSLVSKQAPPATPAASHTLLTSRCHHRQRLVGSCGLAHSAARALEEKMRATHDHRRLHVGVAVAADPPKSILLFYTILKYYTILKGIYSSSVYSAFEAALLQSPTAPPPHCPTHR